MEKIMIKNRNSCSRFFLQFFILVLMGLNPPLTVGMCAGVFSDLHLRFEISVKTANSLQKAGIQTIENLVSKTPEELLRLSNFGRKSLQEVQTALSEKGLSLKEDVSSELGLSYGVRIILHRSGIHTIEDLVSKAPRDLLVLSNFGEKHLRECKPLYLQKVYL